MTRKGGTIKKMTRDKVNDTRMVTIEFTDPVSEILYPNVDEETWDDLKDIHLEGKVVDVVDDGQPSPQITTYSF